MAIKDGLLVNHGYQRPGWGWLVGGCRGVGHEPFPATDALEDLLPMALAEEERLLDLAANTTAAKIEVDGRYVGKTWTPSYRHVNSQEELLALREEVGYSSTYMTYEAYLEITREQLAREARLVRLFIDQCEARIEEGRKLRGEEG